MNFSLTWLPQVLTAAGLKVVETPNWQSRGHGDMGTVKGVLLHHTNGARKGNMPTLQVLIYGRPDLAGPLSQLGLGRDGTYYIVCAGKGWHAGAGSWQGVTDGNSSFIGIEAENVGDASDPWPPVQMDAYRRGVAAILKHIGAKPIMAAGHREYALPAGRKDDPNFDLVKFRADVAAIMAPAQIVLVGANAAPTAPVAPGATKTLAGKITACMKSGGYPLAIGPTVTNIVYVEGMDPDGTPNANRPNAFDATRLVLRVLDDGSASILGAWTATTHAGAYYEHHKLNPDGAFHISLGQQTVWIMGIYHHGNYEALLQARPITGTRDFAEDFKRAGPIFTGDFGVHHHWGYNYPRDDSGNSSAGCQVGESDAGHLEFIALLKTDARYIADHQHVWASTVLPVEWL